MPKGFQKGIIKFDYSNFDIDNYSFLVHMKLM